MNQKVFLCALALFTLSTGTNTVDISPSESSLMALIRSPILFVKGCKSLANSINNASHSFEQGSKNLSTSLDNTGNNIKKAGEHFQEGLTLTSQTIKEAAEKVSNITHTWDPKSRQLSNTLIKECIVSVLGFTISTLGLYLLYHSIYNVLLDQKDQSKNDHFIQKEALSQKAKHVLQKNIRAITAGLIGLSFSYGGFKMIKHNSYLVN